MDVTSLYAKQNVCGRVAILRDLIILVCQGNYSLSPTYLMQTHSVHLVTEMNFAEKYSYLTRDQHAFGSISRRNKTNAMVTTFCMSYLKKKQKFKKVFSVA